MTNSPVTSPTVEPWLRGTHAEVPAVGRAVLHALDLALDDLTKWTEGLTDAEVHAEPLGLTPESDQLSVCPSPARNSEIQSSRSPPVFR